MYTVTLYDHGSYPNGGQVLLDTSSGTNPGIVSATLDTKLNEAGSFTFSIASGHPLYDNAALAIMRGYISVENDEDEIFWGRIITIQKNPMTGTKQINCEGAFAFLLDAELGIDDEAETISNADYFEYCIDEYNDYIGNDPARKILLGDIDIGKADEEHDQKNGEYTQIQQVMKSKLIECNNGYIHIWRDADTKIHYIDWSADSGIENPQSIEISENVTNQTSKESGEDVYTMIRAVGNGSGSERVELAPVAISDALVNKYGKIIRTITFSEATTVGELTAKRTEYISSLQDRVSLSGEIGFVDMHFLDDDETFVLCGDIFTGIVGYEGKRLIAETVTRDLLNPANDKTSLRSEKDVLGKLNAIGANSGVYTGTSSSSSGAGRSLSGSSSKWYKHIHETDESLSLNAKRIEVAAEEKFTAIIGEADIRVTNLGIISGEVGEQKGKWQAFEGTGLYQNKDHITQVAGYYEVDSTTGYLKLKNGTKFDITPSGVQSNVGQLVYEIDGRAKEVGELLLEYQGSYAYQHNNEVGNIVGRYTLQTTLDPNEPYVAVTPPATAEARRLINPSMQGYYERSGTAPHYDYTKSTDQVYNTSKTYYTLNYHVDSVTFDSGGGFKIRHDNAEWGVYDENTLTGGIVVQKINGGGTQTKIKGNKIVLGDQDTDTVSLIEAIKIENKAASGTLTPKADGSIKLLKPTWASFDFYADGNIYMALGTGKYIQTNKVKLIGSGGGSQGVPTVELDQATLSDMIIKASVDNSNGTLTLWKYGANKSASSGDGIITFSRATSLSGSWGSLTPAVGMVLTVSGSPVQNPALEYKISFNQSETVDTLLYLDGNGAATAVSTDLNSANRKNVNVPAKVYWTEGDPGVDHNVFVTTIDGVDASAVYNNGWKKAANAVAWPGAVDTSGTEAAQKEFVVKYPDKNNPDASALTQTFTMTKGATPAASGYASVVLGQTGVARIPIGDWYTAGQGSVKVGYNSAKVIEVGDRTETIQAIEPVTSNGSSYLRLQLDIGTAPSTASPSRTVGIKVGGTLMTELSATLTDYGDGYSAGQTSGYNDGWDNAEGRVVLPSSSSPGSTVSFSYPKKTTSGGNTTRTTDSKTYTLRSTQNDAYLSIQNQDETWTNYAHITHNQYSLGQQSIVNAGGAISQSGECNARTINQFVTTLTVTNASVPTPITGTISATYLENSNNSMAGTYMPNLSNGLSEKKYGKFRVDCTCGATKTYYVKGGKT